MKKFLKILLIVVLVLALLLGGGFAYLYFHGMSGIGQLTEPAPGQIRVACVGDSITYGHGVSNWPDNNYPAVLQGLLGDAYHVNSYGVSGRAVHPESDQPYTALEHYQKSLAYDADIVVFMMGSNDAKPENWHGVEEFKTHLLALLKSYSDATILLCTPATAFFQEPGQTEGPAGYDIQPLVVNEIAQIIRQVAAEEGYPLIDINLMTSECSQWFETDGIHPDKDGAAAIAQEVANAIKGLIAVSALQ